MCGERSSILHYGPLVETDNMYAPTLNGQNARVRRLTKAIYPMTCADADGGHATSRGERLYVS